MNTSTKRSGFTLIEILVVITIIGILSTILYVSFGDARKDARNKALRSEVKEVQLALELYKSQNGKYPEKNSIALLVPEFIAELPDSSKSANPNCELDYDADDDLDSKGSWYKYTAKNCFAAEDKDHGIKPVDPMARCLSNCSTCAGASFDDDYKATKDFYESFAIYSIGGQCE